MLFEYHSSLSSPLSLSSSIFLPSNDSTCSLSSNNEIDVKPRKKKFSSEQEKNKFVETYSLKLKTEMCKNWELKGSCKYSTNCSFAHGKEELKKKTHLNSNFKTKPCKQFFKYGYCNYGYRCQYLHSELKQRSNYQGFLLKNYYKNGISLNCLKGKKYENEEASLKLIEDMMKIIKLRILTFDDVYKVVPQKSKRLEIFQSFSQQRKN